MNLDMDYLLGVWNHPYKVLGKRSYLVLTRAAVLFASIFVTGLLVTLLARCGSPDERLAPRVVCNYFAWW